MCQIIWFQIIGYVGKKFGRNCKIESNNRRNESKTWIKLMQFFVEFIFQSLWTWEVPLLSFKCLSAVETIYAIWRASNEMVFSQQCIDPCLKDTIIYSIVMRCTLHRKFSIHVDVTTLCIEQHSWIWTL
jgi:hypothetical protein